jgi:hypothetical protein
MKKFSALICSGALFSSAFAADPVVGLPWFTGPLLTPSPYVVGLNHINIEPYVFYTDTNGRYNKDRKREDVVSEIQWFEQIPVQIGIANNVEFDIIPGLVTNSKSGQTQTSLADTTAALYYQVYRSPDDSLLPSVKMGLRVTFPTGKYHNLSIDKRGVDATSVGCYATTLTFALGKCYHIYGDHFLNFRTFFGYSYGFPRETTGLNTYGGADDTYGTIYVGSVYSWFLGLEYSLTKNWCLAFDLAYLYQNRTRFKGERGTILIPGEDVRIPAPIGTPSSDQWSMATAIEYNFNEHVGIITGPWFTLAGRNAGAFISWATAINLWF